MGQLKFSANLGLLWTDRSLPEAIHAAAIAGFDAVECHWPYDVAIGDVRAALATTGLKMLGLNTRRGDVSAGENGLAALIGRKADARASIDEAIDYATGVGAKNIHVMAGVTKSVSDTDTDTDTNTDTNTDREKAAEAAFSDSLKYAAAHAAKQGLNILIEPLNLRDNPGYFLTHCDQARRIITGVGAPNLKLMFDCYHVQITEGDVVRRLSDNLDIIGHIQFAAVPDRGPPDHGDLDYYRVFEAIKTSGYDAPLGAEYRSASPTTASLDWLNWAR